MDIGYAGRSKLAAQGEAELPWNFHGPDHTNVVSFVRSFCSDYTTWNNAAMSVTQGLAGEKKRGAMNEASEAYARLLAPFIAPETKPHLMAFGSDSTFDPSRFGRENVEDTSNRYEVRVAIKHSHLDFENDYIAEIKKLADGRLVLMQIWYLDPFAEAGQERLPYL